MTNNISNLIATRDALNKTLSDLNKYNLIVKIDNGKNEPFLTQRAHNKVKQLIIEELEREYRRIVQKIDDYDNR